MNTETVINRFNILPEMLQYQVADYIEFLINRYQSDKVPDEELNQETKDLLDKRMAEYEKNPNDVVSWEDIKKEFNTKHGYAI